MADGGKRKPFSFPLLSRRDIISSLSGFGVDVTEADLVKPTEEVLRPVYEHFVEYIAGKTRDDLSQPNFSILEKVQFPEMHINTIGNLAFSRSLTSIMETAGISDFSRKDIYKPEPDRVTRHISAVINYAKFRTQKMQFFQDHIDRSHAATDRIQQVKEANVRLMQDLKILEEKEVSEIPEVEELKIQYSQLEEMRRPKKDDFSKLQAEEKRLTGTRTGFAEKMNAAKREMEIGTREIENLKSMLAESPEKVQRDVEEYHKILETEKSTIEEEEKKFKNFQQQLECVSKVEKKVKKYSSMMQEIEKKVASQKQLLKNLKETKGQISANEKQAASLREARDHVARQIHSSEDRLQKQKQITLSSRTQHSLSLQHAEERRRELAEKMKEVVLKLEERKKQIAVNLAEKEIVRATWENDKKKLVSEFNALYRQAAKYLMNLSENMENPPKLPPKPIF